MNTISPGVTAPLSTANRRPPAPPQARRPPPLRRAALPRAVLPRLRRASLAPGARLRAGENAVERGIVGLGLVEQLDEVSRLGPDVLRGLVGIEQPRNPAHPDGTVDRGRLVDPAEWQARRKIDPPGRGR